MEQTNLWDDDEGIVQNDPLDPEIEQIKDITRQNKDLRLMEPLYKLVQNKGFLGKKNKDDNSERITKNIDPMYLSILTLEYYSCFAISHDSISAQEVIDYLKGKVATMDKTLTDDECYRIAEWVHNGLCNQQENYKAFSTPYFNGELRKTLLYEFWLIKIVDIDDGNQCKITEEGISVLFNIINADPRLEAEITSLLREKLIVTGRYEEALQLVHRASKQVAQYQERIRAATDKARRSAISGEISSTILPLIEDSRILVKKRISEEDDILEKIRILMSSKKESLDFKGMDILTKLQYAIGENLNSYQSLFSHISKSFKEIESIIKTLLTPASGVIPDLANGLLDPMCTWPISLLSEKGDDIINIILPAKPNYIFDPVNLLGRLDIDGEQDLKEKEEIVNDDLVDIKREKPLFSANTLIHCEAYFKQNIENKEQFTLQEILKQAKDEGFTKEFQHCLSYYLIMHFSDNEGTLNVGLNINVKKLDVFKHDFMKGHNLLIKKV